jgi:hypothetical protein
MDHRGNMSSQHRRSKINHSLVVGPELTKDQQIIANSKKKLSKMDEVELGLWLEVCKANIVFWKNRRSAKNRWEKSLEMVEKEINKRNES